MPIPLEKCPICAEKMTITNGYPSWDNDVVHTLHVRWTCIESSHKVAFEKSYAL